MHYDGGCLGSAIVIVFSTINIYHQKCFQLSKGLTVFVSVDCQLKDCHLGLHFGTSIIYEYEEFA